MSLPDPFSIPIPITDRTYGADAAAEGVAPNLGSLGAREREVLEVVWNNGRLSVGQVTDRLSSPLAYTTVMTTLDRLFKKGLLHRARPERAFLYSPALSPADVESGRARALLRRFFEGSRSSPETLISCLVDVIGDYDDELLRSLEDKVRIAKEKAAKLQLNERQSGSAMETASATKTASAMKSEPATPPVSKSATEE